MTFVTHVCRFRLPFRRMLFLVLFAGTICSSLRMSVILTPGSGLGMKSATRFLLSTGSFTWERFGVPIVCLCELICSTS